MEGRRKDLISRVATLFKMSSFQQKIMKHARKHKADPHTGLKAGKRTACESGQRLDLPEKAFKVAITDVFKR